jgi:hypothetical protein
MLDLGLESLNANETVNTTVADVLTAQMSVVRAEADMMNSLRDMYECEKDVQNYLEIMNSLKVHSSDECFALAADLLGTDVASLEEEANDIELGKRYKVNKPGASKPAESEKKPGKLKAFWERAKEITTNTIKRIKEFFTTVWNWIKKTASAIASKVRSGWNYVKETPLRIKVWFTTAQLKVLAKYAKFKAGKNEEMKGKIDKAAERPVLTSLKEVAEWQKQAAETIKAYIDALKTADKETVKEAVANTKTISNGNNAIAQALFVQGAPAA